jgi:hypothetical protein
MLKWQTEYLIPIIDTFRMALLHPASNAFLYKHGNAIISKLLEVLKNGSDTHKIIVLRLFNNMFISQNNRQVMLKNRSDILDSASVYLDSENNNLRSAIVSLLFKYFTLMLAILLNFLYLLMNWIMKLIFKYCL